MFLTAIITIKLTCLPEKKKTFVDTENQFVAHLLCSIMANYCFSNGKMIQLMHYLPKLYNRNFMKINKKNLLTSHLISFKLKINNESFQ